MIRTRVAYGINEQKQLNSIIYLFMLYILFWYWFIKNSTIRYKSNNKSNLHCYFPFYFYIVILNRLLNSYGSVVWLIVTQILSDDDMYSDERECTSMCCTNPLANKKRKSWSVKILPQIFVLENRYYHVTDSRWHLKCVQIFHTTLL